LDKKAYKLVLWTDKEKQISNYLGVRNCFRNRKYDKKQY
jgi:hypothetical protein